MNIVITFFLLVYEPFHGNNSKVTVVLWQWSLRYAWASTEFINQSLLSAWTYDHSIATQKAHSKTIKLGRSESTQGTHANLLILSCANSYFSSNLKIWGKRFKVWGNAKVGWLTCTTYMISSGHTLLALRQKIICVFQVSVWKKIK